MGLCDLCGLCGEMFGMMKTLVKVWRASVKTLRISLSLLLFSSLALPTNLRAEDLIAPTRSLEGPREPLGKLNVASEPPGLEVFLDDSEIGRTPIWRKNVKPGLHKLRVRDLEADVYVEPGRSKTLSFFQDSFIEVPEKREAPKRTEPESEKPPEARKATKPSEEERGKDLTPWEWQRFLNRTSPGF